MPQYVVNSPITLKARDHEYDPYRGVLYLVKISNLDHVDMAQDWLTAHLGPNAMNHATYTQKIKGRHLPNLLLVTEAQWDMYIDPVEFVAVTRIKDHKRIAMLFHLLHGEAIKMASATERNDY